MSAPEQQQMELPVEGQATLAVWVRGEVWSYKEGSTRIYSFGGQEINVWSHQAGAPSIAFTRQSIEARVKEWLDDDAEDPPEPERLIRCRSRASDECYDGKPEAAIYEDGQEDDGTWDGETVVCDACYIAIGQPVASNPRTIAQPPERRRASTPEGMTDEEWSKERFGLNGEDA